MIKYICIYSYEISLYEVYIDIYNNSVQKCAERRYARDGVPLYISAWHTMIWLKACKSLQKQCTVHFYNNSYNYDGYCCVPNRTVQGPDFLKHVLINLKTNPSENYTSNVIPTSVYLCGRVSRRFSGLKLLRSRLTEIIRRVIIFWNIF